MKSRDCCSSCSLLYGGIIYVLFVKRGNWFWPTYVCLPCALLAILARMPDRLDWLGFGYAPLLFDPNLLNWQSFQELFFSLFLFLYLLSIWYRLAAGARRGDHRLPQESLSTAG